MPKPMRAVVLGSQSKPLMFKSTLPVLPAPGAAIVRRIMPFTVSGDAGAVIATNLQLPPDIKFFLQLLRVTSRLAKLVF
jgi:hypothetical protein